MRVHHAYVSMTDLGTNAAACKVCGGEQEVFRREAFCNLLHNGMKDRVFYGDLSVILQAERNGVSRNGRYGNLYGME